MPITTRKISRVISLAVLGWAGLAISTLSHRALAQVAPPPGDPPKPVLQQAIPQRALQPVAVPPRQRLVTPNAQGNQFIAPGGGVSIVTQPIVRPAPPLDVDIPAELVSQLDSPDFQAREDAMQKIGAPGEHGLAAIDRALAQPSLSPEQRQRLITAGFQVFKGTARGALGVGFEGTTASGVLVKPVQQPGFDAWRALRNDDAIRAIDGRRVEDQQEVRIAIVSRDPGDELPMTISRDGEAVQVSVKLGSYDSLNNRQGLDDETLSASWQYRLSRNGHGLRGPVIDAGLSLEQWTASAQRQAAARAGKNELTHDPFTGDPIRSPLPKALVSALAMGGEARVQLARAWQGLAGGRDGSIRIGPGRDLVIFPERAGGRATSPAALRALMQSLQAQRSGLVAEATNTRMRMMDPATTADARAQLQGQLVQLNTERAQVEQELRDLALRMSGREP